MARTVLVLLVLVFTGLFALLNWTAFNTPTSLNFGFGTLNAPLGMLMLGLIALLSVVFTVWALSLQGRLLVDSRNQAKELQAQRQLADDAEASRFTELRQFVGAELQRIRQEAEAAHVGLMTRLGQMEQESRRRLDESARLLAAGIADLDDRLERRDLPAGLPARIDEVERRSS
jgi:uncharacterized integral membrane protein